MSTSTVPAVLDAARTALAAYTGLTAVSVWTGPQGNMHGENIVLASDEIVVAEECEGIGENDRDESYSIPCVTWVEYPNGTETEIKACRDRVYTLFGLVESYFNDATPQTVTATCRDAQVSGHTFRQGLLSADVNGRWAQIDFTIDVEAQKAP